MIILTICLVLVLEIKLLSITMQDWFFVAVFFKFFNNSTLNSYKSFDKFWLYFLQYLFLVTREDYLAIILFIGLASYIHLSLRLFPGFSSFSHFFLLLVDYFPLNILYFLH